MSAQSHSSGPYQGGIKMLDQLTNAPGDAPYNEQVLRFVLLTDLLASSGMCLPDAKACLNKYVRALSGNQRAQLQRHFPNTHKLAENGGDFDLSLDGIAALSTERKMPTKHIEDALRAARLRLIEDPDWMTGQNGWLMWAAFNIAGKPIFSEDGEKRTLQRVEARFWLPHVEHVLWVGYMARLTVAWDPTRNDDEFLCIRKAAYREAWYYILGIFFSRGHFIHECECDGKDGVFPEEDYNGSIKWVENNVADNKAQDKHRRIRYEEELSKKAGGIRVQSLYPQAGTMRNPPQMAEQIFIHHWRDEAFLEHCKYTLRPMGEKFIRRCVEEIQRDYPRYYHRGWRKARTQASQAAAKVKGTAPKVTKPAVATALKDSTAKTAGGREPTAAAETAKAKAAETAETK